MEFDKLTYELKYKNDQMVIDLLKEYLNQEDKLYLYQYTESDLEQANQEGREMIKSDIRDYADELDIIADGLTSDIDKEKEKSIKKLEKLIQRMRF